MTRRAQRARRKNGVCNGLIVQAAANYSGSWGVIGTTGALAFKLTAFSVKLRAGRRVCRSRMKNWLVPFVIRLLGRLPLSAGRALGALVGWLLWYSNSRPAKITRENLQIGRASCSDMVKFMAVG